MAKAVFNIIAKDPEEQHVAEQVPKAAMHEHRCDHGQVHGDGSGLQSGYFKSLSLMADQPVLGNDISAGNDLRGDGGE